VTSAYPPKGALWWTCWQPLRASNGPMHCSKTVSLFEGLRPVRNRAQTAIREVAEIEPTHYDGFRKNSLTSVALGAWSD
jgi:hypothetical protein